MSDGFWTFWEYGDVITVWLQDQTETTKAKFNTRLRALRDQPPGTWRRPLVDTLGKECSGLIEVRFKSHAILWRPLGFHGPEARQFTIVFFATERGDEFVPKNACSVALSRKTEILTGEVEVKRYELPRQ